MRRAAMATAVAALLGVQLLVAAGSHAAPPRRSVTQLKIVNYYPAAAGWTRMWTSYSQTRTASDFHAIASLGANAVRIIVQPQAVGYPTVNSTMLSRFHDMLTLAAKNGLSVQLTLFDWWQHYTDLAGSRTWLHSLLAGESRNTTIALVELQNEIPTESTVAMAWARTMMPELSRVLPGVPRTLSASGASGLGGVLSLAADMPVSALDVIDVHYYGDPSMSAVTLSAAKAAAAGRPVIVGEAGRTSLGSGGEEAQAQFFRVLGLVTHTLQLPPPAPWTLSDFTASGPPHSMNPTEYHYGLRRTNGTWKPVASVVRALFAGQVPVNSDGSFEREHNGAPVLGSWTRFDTADGAAVVEHTVTRTGTSAVCFSGTRGGDAAVPSVMQSFPVLSPGRWFTASAWVRRLNGAGSERIALAWFDRNGRYLGQSQSPRATTQGRWQRLTVTAPAAVGAVRVAVHLKAARESGRACYDDATITW